MLMGDNICMVRSLIKFLAETQFDRWLKKPNSRSHDLTVLGRGKIRARIPFANRQMGKLKTSALYPKQANL
jgi:hypothetical protein